MTALIRGLFLGACVIAAFPCLAAGPVVEEKPRAQIIGLRVTVDAVGKVQSAQPSDPLAVAGLNRAAEELARKLVFTPARKDGVAVASETSLSVTLSLEPRADGQYGLQLKRASNGPGVLAVGKMVPPRYQQGSETGALVVVGVTVRADGTADLSTLTTERMQLRVPSTFAEARYLDAIKTSLRGSRFELDKVAGVSIASRVSAPYRFGAGPSKPNRGETERSGGQKPAQDIELPTLTAVSNVPGIELAKIDYRAATESRK